MTEMQPEMKDCDALPHFNLQTKLSSKSTFAAIISFPQIIRVSQPGKKTPHDAFSRPVLYTITIPSGKHTKSWKYWSFDLFLLGGEVGRNNVDSFLYAALYVGEVTWVFKITKYQALLNLLFCKKASFWPTDSTHRIHQKATNGQQ